MKKFLFATAALYLLAVPAVAHEACAPAVANWLNPSQWTCVFNSGGQKSVLKVRSHKKYDDCESTASSCGCYDRAFCDERSHSKRGKARKG